MELITLIENNLGSNPNLQCEFGFSVFIKDNDLSLIFDTGQTGKFINNIKKLNINTENIKHVILSHSHYDHTGGLKSYIENFNPSFTLHINENFFDKKYSLSDSVSRFLGNNFSQHYLNEKKINIHFISDHIHILSKNITLFTNFNLITDFEIPNATYFKRKNNTFIKDNMTDEIVLGLDTSIGFVLLCGCSHVGIVNIIKNVQNWTGKKVVGIIGGLHLSKASNDRIEKVIEFLKVNNIKFLAVSHCTGENILTQLKQNYFSIVPNNTGTILNL